MPNKFTPTNTIFDSITSSLSNIDGSVSELNTCSTGDFIMLNNYLKKQYSRIESISENVSSVFDLTAGTENIALSAKIQHFQTEFKKSLRCSENFFGENADIIDRVISYLNLMYIPLKNYAQNIFTLSFLSSSLKFNLLLNKDKRDNFNTEIELFNTYIKEVKRVNALFEESLTEIKTLHDKIQEKLREQKENNHINTERAEEKISTALKNLYDKKYEGERRIPELRKIKTRYQENVSKIITNLQYSDIIRQKIEHISEAHRHMIEKIQAIRDKNDTALSKQYMLQIKDIADLQIAQLIRTNHEYQTAVQVISEKFVDIRSDINELTGDTLKISGLRSVNPVKHHDFYMVEEQLERVQEITNKYVLRNNDIDDNIETTKKILQKYHSDYIEYTNITQKVSELSQSVIAKSRAMFADQSNIMDIITQFETVCRSADSNKSDISRYFGKCSSDYEKLENDNINVGCRDVRTFDTDIKVLLQEIKEKNISIRDIIVETEKIERTVSGDITSAVKEIKYYMFYEQAASNIIIRLKELFDLIEIEHTSEIEKVENLKEHRSSYTMKSERLVHDNVALGKQTGDVVEDEEEIEFF
jgi:hypothetical protein